MFAHKRVVDPFRLVCEWQQGLCKEPQRGRSGQSDRRSGQQSVTLNTSLWHCADTLCHRPTHCLSTLFTHTLARTHDGSWKCVSGCLSTRHTLTTLVCVCVWKRATERDKNIKRGIERGRERRGEVSVYLRTCQWVKKSGCLPLSSNQDKFLKCLPAVALLKWAILSTRVIIVYAKRTKKNIRNARQPWSLMSWKRGDLRAAFITFPCFFFLQSSNRALTNISTFTQ